MFLNDESVTFSNQFLQICAGKVTTLHLYQGAFVDIGGVYEG